MTPQMKLSNIVNDCNTTSSQFIPDRMKITESRKSLNQMSQLRNQVSMDIKIHSDLRSQIEASINSHYN